MSKISMVAGKNNFMNFLVNFDSLTVGMLT